MPPLFISVCTPTYNRAHLLGDLYHSLVSQTFRNFEWIIVDDGSTDDTSSLVAGWIQESRIPIVTICQPNSGKHVAVNAAVEAAQGEFCMVQDSDDLLLPDALERIEGIWRGLSEEARTGLDGVMGLCVLADGALLPKKFPLDAMNMSHREYWFQYGMKGDKCAVVRTSLLRRYPSPRLAGETFLVEAVSWNRMNPRFRCVNEPFRIVRYQSGGLSAQAVVLRRRSPQGARLCYAEASRLPISALFRLRHLVNYVRYSVPGGYPLDEWLTGRHRALFALAVPLGMLMVLLDDLRMLPACLSVVWHQGCIPQTADEDDKT